MSIIPGIDIAEPDRTETRSGLAGVAEALAGLALERCHMRPDVGHQVVGQGVPVEVGEAGRGRDDEPGGNVETDLRHRAQIGAFAAEQHLVGGIAFFEREDVPVRSHVETPAGPLLHAHARRVAHAHILGRRLAPHADVGQRPGSAGAAAAQDRLPARRLTAVKASRRVCHVH